MFSLNIFQDRIWSKVTPWYVMFVVDVLSRFKLQNVQCSKYSNIFMTLIWRRRKGQSKENKFLSCLTAVMLSIQQHGIDPIQSKAHTK